MVPMTQIRLLCKYVCTKLTGELGVQKLNSADVDLAAGHCLRKKKYIKR
jgi:hypothetical protein